MEFRTEFNRERTKGQVFPKNEMKEYQWQIDENGKKDLLKWGK